MIFGLSVCLSVSQSFYHFQAARSATSSVCLYDYLSVCLSGLENICAKFCASGPAARYVCLQSLGTKGTYLYTLNPPSTKKLFHRSLKQVVNLSCLYKYLIL